MRPLFGLLLAGLFWVSCSRDPKAVAGGWTDTETGTKVSGLILDEGGRPASGALVLLRPSDYLSKHPTQSDSQANAKSKGSILDGVCDSSGHFYLDSVGIGKYSLEVRERELKSVLIQFEIIEKSAPITLPTSTVRAVGNISGVVHFSDSSNGQTLVRIFGLEKAIIANRNGAFNFGAVPAGTFTLNFSSLEPFAAPGEKADVRVAADSGTDAGTVTLERELKQAFRIVEGFLEIEGVDSTNPVILENGAFINPVDGAYLWAKASKGHLDLRGTLVSYSKDSGEATLPTNMQNCLNQMELARASGMRGIADPIAGSPHMLAQSASGLLEDIVPAPSEGSRLVIMEAHKASVQKPLVVLCGANMTTVANALLQDPSIANRIVIIGTNNNNFNSQDTLALAVVAKRARFIAWAREYTWNEAGLPFSGTEIFPLNPIGQALKNRYQADTISSTWAFSFYADFGPATFLFKRKVWSQALAADFMGFPLQAKLGASFPFDFVEIPASANDWSTMQSEFLNTLNDPAVYHTGP